MKGLVFTRVFTEKDVHPYDKLEWEKRDVKIVDHKGNVAFEQESVEVPKNWSQLATDIAASKYMRRAGIPESERETSVKQLVDRVAKSITASGVEQGGYFATKIDQRMFQDELTHILINQIAAFNSPVWFNCGLWFQYGITGNKGNYYYDLDELKVKESEGYKQPQNSACFIQSVEDSIDSMVALQESEIKLFKYGSGTGTNFSKIRAAGEPLTSGGEGSGVLSFLEGFDTWAGCIKSGGTTRRSAKMVILDMDHPEIEDFIKWKVKEENKAKALIGAGYDSNFNGEAYSTVSGQNSNNSVRVPDKFMQAFEEELTWETIYRVSGKVAKKYEATDLMDMIAESAWQCGDPGVQFDDMIQNWNTCKSSGKINASNPCAEFLFLDNTACNLASINLVKFLEGSGYRFNVDEFAQTVKVLITAMDIIVDMSSYPQAKIAKETHDFRPLGLGYANLGALLMRLGVPYDSEEGRNIAAYITSLLTGHGYKTSALIAQSKGCFSGYNWNASDMKHVIKLHKTFAITTERSKKGDFTPLSKSKDTPIRCWYDAENLASDYGYRNSQISVIAPTGTISFLMDCDTLGIEPDFSLVKYKILAGGGNLKIVNQSLEPALKMLDYTPNHIDEIKEYVLENGTIENAPFVKPEHYSIFDCAVAPEGSNRVIDYMAHVKMLGSVQPLISGGISKTCNLPEDITKEEIKQLYIEAWNRGVKCLAVYRDNCKSSQPLNTKEEVDENNIITTDKMTDQSSPQRKKLPDTRPSITHKFSIDGNKGYVHVGLYDDGRPGEVFIRMNKEGSTISGTFDTAGILISIALQNGVPLQSLVDKFTGKKFEPSGFTDNEDIPVADSIIDYIFKWLDNQFGGKNE